MHCLLCAVEVGVLVGVGEHWRLDCPHCGSFEFDEAFGASVGQARAGRCPDLLPYLPYYVTWSRRAADRGHRLRFSGASAPPHVSEMDGRDPARTAARSAVSPIEEFWLHRFAIDGVWCMWKGRFFTYCRIDPDAAAGVRVTVQAEGAAVYERRFPTIEFAYAEAHALHEEYRREGWRDRPDPDMASA